VLKPDTGYRVRIAQSQRGRVDVPPGQYTPASARPSPVERCALAGSPSNDRGGHKRMDGVPTAMLVLYRSAPSYPQIVPQRFQKRQRESKKEKLKPDGEMRQSLVGTRVLQCQSISVKDR
jgi:hypothetical protein